MTYARARLIIWNPDAYRVKEVVEAAIFVLGSLAASTEDVAQASLLL